MSKFKIGEIAILLRAYKPENQHLAGADVEIVSSVRNAISGATYSVMIDGLKCEALSSINGEWSCLEANLAKKKPPKEAATWEDIQEITGWKPSKIREYLE